MPAVVNTVRAIEALRPGPKVRCYRIDSNLRLRVSTNGAKSFNVRFRVNGRNQEKTLGPYGHQPGQWTLHAALAEAAKVAAAARNNVDVLEAQKRERIVREGATLTQVFEAWFSECIAEKRGRKGRKDGGKVMRRQAELHWLGHFGERHIGDIGKTEVIAHFRAISRSGKNRTAVVAFRQMMAWGNCTQPYRRLLTESDFFALKVEDIVVGSYHPVHSNERSRVLDDEEIRLLAQKMAASTLPYYAVHAVYIMLGTGCRVGELSVARWENVDLEASLWTLRAPDTKTQVEITVALSPFVLRQFEALRAMHKGRYVFPRRLGVPTEAELPIDGATLGKLVTYRQMTPAEHTRKPTVLDHDALVLPGGRWRAHDLRRSGATIMQRCGVDDSVVHRCLNHSSPHQLDRVYLREALTPAMRAAWLALGTYLDRLFGTAAEPANETSHDATPLKIVA